MPCCQLQNTKGLIFHFVSHPVNEPLLPDLQQTLEMWTNTIILMSGRTKAQLLSLCPCFCDFTKRHLLLVPRLLCHEQSQWWTVSVQIHKDFQLYTTAQHQPPAAIETPCWWLSEINITGKCYYHMLNFPYNVNSILFFFRKLAKLKQWDPTWQFKTRIELNMQVEWNYYSYTSFIFRMSLFRGYCR